MVVGRCGGHHILLWRPKRIGTWRAVHTRVHPRCIRSGVTKDRWYHSPYIWPIRDQQSGFVEGWKAWHKIDWHMLVAGLPPEDLSANARATGEVLAVEQSSNNDKGDVGNTIQVLAELKKQSNSESPPSRRHIWMHPCNIYAVLAEIPATNPNPADAHSTKNFGVHQPRPSPGSPSSVTS